MPKLVVPMAPAPAATAIRAEAGLHTLTSSNGSSRVCMSRKATARCRCSDAASFLAIVVMSTVSSLFVSLDDRPQEFGHGVVFGTVDGREVPLADRCVGGRGVERNPRTEAPVARVQSRIGSAVLEYCDVARG